MLGRLVREVACCVLVARFRRLDNPLPRLDITDRRRLSARAITEIEPFVLDLCELHAGRRYANRTSGVDAATYSGCRGWPSLVVPRQ
jgi:hypothetical protein